jgi:hypothetical protein
VHKPNWVFIAMSGKAHAVYECGRCHIRDVFPYGYPLPEDEHEDAPR